MKVVILVPFCSEAIERLRAAVPDAELILAPDAGVEAQTELLRTAQVVIGEPELDAIAASESLRLVQMTWAGTDKYTRCARPFPDGVSLCSASGAFGRGMAQYALGTVLALYRRIPEYLEQKRARLWRELPAERSVVGKCVLIFGTGNVGSCTAKLFRAAGAGHISGVRRRTDCVPDGFDDVCSLEAAQELIPTADIIIGCMPNSDENQGYLNEQRLMSMKSDALLVNMGRGAFVDCAALARVLDRGRLFGAALDVTEPEPLPPEHPLWDCDRLIITPHMAGPSFGCPETERAICDICADNLRRYATGAALRNKVI